MFLNGVLRPKLLNVPLVSCLLTNLDFLLLHAAHFHNSIVLPLLVFKTLEFMSSVFCLHFRQYDSIVSYLRL